MEDDLNFSKMEDDLNFFKNGRRPQLFQKWKTTSIFQKMEDNLNLNLNWKPKLILGLAKLSKIFLINFLAISANSIHFKKKN
jgi:hypothetical protein